MHNRVLLSETFIQEANTRRRGARSRRTTTTLPGSSRAGASTPKALVERAMAFTVAVPTWGLGVGRHPIRALCDSRRAAQCLREARGLRGRVQSSRAPRRASRCIFRGTTPENPGELRAFAHARGLFVDSMNSNTFQDQPGQPLSYKFGSLSHTDAAVRRQAIEHNLECLEIGDGARRARAHRLDWRRRQFSGPAALPARARSISRQHEARSIARCRSTGGCSSSTSFTSRPSIRRC